MQQVNEIMLLLFSNRLINNNDAYYINENYYFYSNEFKKKSIFAWSAKIKTFGSNIQMITRSNGSNIDVLVMKSNVRISFEFESIVHLDDMDSMLWIGWHE